MKRLFTLIALLVVSGIISPVHAREFPIPKDFVFDGHKDLKQYTPYILPCISWLQETPLNEDIEGRAKINFFVLTWLQINPDLSISLPEYSYKLNGINRDLLYLFLEGWIKYTLETKDTAIVACSMAGLNTMLDYYLAGKAASIGKIEFLDNMALLRKDGRLKGLFDTGHVAKNTFIYLKAPYNRNEFRYEENYFGFHYYTINLLNPRAIKYRYMLDGYYNDWIETTDGSVTYPRLPPGTYTFKVQASMYPDFGNAPESSYSFTIKKPYWMEYWFIALVAGLVVLLIYYIIKQREKSLKNLAMLQQERVIFEYEHLKSQVNPHFLFNTLNTLANLIAKDQEKAISYTEDLSRLYQQILAYRDNDLILLSEEIAILDNYILIQRGRFSDALKLNIDISSTILKTKKIVPMALQILIENAIKHNVVSASEPLVIYITTDDLEIVISNKVRPKMSREKGEGLGLVNIKKRYELLTKKTVVYGLQDDEFVVRLPLL